MVVMMMMMMMMMKMMMMISSDNSFRSHDGLSTVDYIFISHHIQPLEVFSALCLFDSSHAFSTQALLVPQLPCAGQRLREEIRKLRSLSCCSHVHQRCLTRSPQGRCTQLPRAAQHPHRIWSGSFFFCFSSFLLPISSLICRRSCQLSEPIASSGWLRMMVPALRITACALQQHVKHSRSFYFLRLTLIFIAAFSSELT
jgi:hypothetical protein